MAGPGYWTAVRRRAIGRRRLLEGIAVGAGGLALAACGGSSSSSKTTSSSSTNHGAGKQAPATAESTPAGLTWTVKLRPHAKFHNVSPVNGRAVTSDDVKFSWERATGDKGINRAQLSFVTKIQYPDAQTVVFTLQAPNAAFL